MQGVAGSSWWYLWLQTLRTHVDKFNNLHIITFSWRFQFPEQGLVRLLPNFLTWVEFFFGGGATSQKVPWKIGTFRSLLYDSNVCVVRVRFYNFWCHLLVLWSLLTDSLQPHWKSRYMGRIIYTNARYSCSLLRWHRCGTMGQVYELQRLKRQSKSQICHLFMTAGIMFIL